LTGVVHRLLAGTAGGVPASPTVSGVTGWIRRIALVSGALVVLATSACTGDSPGPVEPPRPQTSGSGTSSGAAPPTNASPSGTVEEQILAQYRRFWTESLPAAHDASPQDRKAILATTVMEPALSFIVDGIAEMDRAGEKGYGYPIPVRETIKRHGSTALTTGCLDSSHAGTADARSGRILTKGPDSEAVLVTLKRSADGIWRVYETGFPEDSRC
jgi:hypothetical protein